MEARVVSPGCAEVAERQSTQREKYSNVLQTHIVIVGQMRIYRFSPNFDIASRNRLHIN